MNLSHWIERWAGFAGGKTAIRYEGADFTYADFAERVGRAAHALTELGVKRADRVAWLGLNNPESLALLFACARIGAIYLPLNWRLAPAEQVALLENAEPALLLMEPEFAAAWEARNMAMPGLKVASIGGPRRSFLDWDSLLVESAILQEGDGRYEDPLLLCYTSGTTGQPRGAVHTQESMLWNAVNSTHMHDLTSEDRVLTILPMFHVGGLNIQTVPALHAGASVVLHRKFDSTASLAALASQHITLTVVVPTQIELMIAQPGWQTADLSSLRSISIGSTIVPPALIRKVQARGVPVIQVYGSTETGPVSVYQRRADAHQVGVAGRCGLHVEMRIVDDSGRQVALGTSGEIVLRARNVMTGYWRDATATAAALKDGWFFTGDIGHLEPDGYLVVEERKQDMIISGGENICPAALEAILGECPDILEAAVVGRPDERWGEVPVAVVVPREGACLTQEGVLALFHDRVARYKHPQGVLFLSQLPRSAVRKLLKGDLRNLVRRMPWPPAKAAGRSA